jgi:hypothetical protein
MNIRNKTWAKIGSIIIFSLFVFRESKRLINQPEYPSRLYFIVIFSIFLGMVIGDIIRDYKEQKKYK